MGFDVAADAYGQFMGRYSEPLARQYVSLVSDRLGPTVLDVGSGPGALTAVLAERLGESNVTAIDPSVSFVTALRARLPGVDARQGSAERLPFADHAFASTMSQLVVQFMTDPVAGIAEMARVTRPGGLVSACVWDQVGGVGPLATFWRSMRELDPTARDESDRPGVRAGHLVELFEQAGVRRVEPATLTVQVRFADFESWWHPYTLGVGPAGDYVAGLEPSEVEILRQRCSAHLPPAPFTISATAWTAIGVA
jgi:SAM-dependent methyltransferase